MVDVEYFFFNQLPSPSCKATVKKALRHNEHETKTLIEITLLEYGRPTLNY